MINVLLLLGLLVGGFGVIAALQSMLGRRARRSHRPGVYPPDR